MPNWLKSSRRKQAPTMKKNNASLTLKASVRTVIVQQRLFLSLLVIVILAGTAPPCFRRWCSSKSSTG